MEVVEVRSDVTAVFVWGASQKSACYPFLKRLYGNKIDICFMANGTGVQALSDAALEGLGLRRMTKDEFLDASIAREQAKQAAAAPAPAPELKAEQA